MLKKKTMKCSLSSILDLSEEDTESSQRSIFSKDDWNKLIAKYSFLKMGNKSKYTTLQEKWEIMSNLSVKNNYSSPARRYIAVLESESIITPTQIRVLGLFKEVLFLINSCRFILNPKNKSKVSERDFAYQLWLPFFKKLFHVHEEMVRIQLGETVLTESTESKAATYGNCSNIIGFKVDIRFIYDFEEEVFDLGCGEACMSNSPDMKLDHDMSKLLREGKFIQTTLQNVIADNNCVFSWILQITGDTCCFYTVHATKHQYHICIPQFTASFPSEYSQLSNFFKTLENIFLFRDHVEKLANKLEACILKIRTELTSECLQGVMRSPERILPSVSYSPPLYYTPPRNEYQLSHIPEYVLMEELSESDHKSQGSFNTVDYCFQDQSDVST